MDNKIEYKYNEFGKIDWFATLPRKFLVVNRQKYLDKSKTPPESIDGLPDSDLLILLSGIRFLADERGFIKIEYPVINSSSNHCTVVCQITWDLSVENNQIIVSSGIGDATPDNTKSFARYYLGPIAENRAFTRCVRQFLRIPVLGAEELGDVKMENESNQQSNNSNLLDPVNTLLKIIENKGKTPEKFLKRCVEIWKIEGSENWKTLNDIPKDKILGLIEKLNS